MIFGKTYEQKRKEEQEFFKKFKDCREKRFAWLPVPLHDGRIVWLTNYYTDYHIFQSEYSDEYKYMYISHHAEGRD